MPTPPPWRVFDAPSTAAAPDTSPPRSPLPVTAIGAFALAALLAAAGVGLVVAGYGPSDTPAASEESEPSREVVIEVVGAVAHPGVYHLAIGARVADAIEAAGGFGPRVDAERSASELSLATQLIDGARVVVPSRDEKIPSTGPDGDGTALVDLNHATVEALDKLPGIGPVTAQKIVDARRQKPFGTVDELRSRGIVGQKTFDRIRALLTAG